eukprot:9068873-Pyramimonas_sp.AAC.1
MDGMEEEEADVAIMDVEAAAAPEAAAEAAAAPEAEDGDKSPWTTRTGRSRCYYDDGTGIGWHILHTRTRDRNRALDIHAPALRVS